MSPLDSGWFTATNPWPHAITIVLANEHTPISIIATLACPGLQLPMVAKHEYYTSKSRVYHEGVET